MLETGQIVKLNDDKEFIVVNILELHNLRYVFLISNFKPLEIVIAAEKISNGNIILEEVKNNEELDYILNKFALTKEEYDAEI